MLFYPLVDPVVPTTTYREDDVHALVVGERNILLIPGISSSSKPEH